MLKMVHPEVKQVLLNMNATLCNTNWTPFFPIKKLVLYTVSFYKDISLPSHSERNLNNLPSFSTMCLRDTALKTGIGHNKMAIAKCNTVVTVLRLIATNSLSIKWLHPNYIEHWSNNKIENSSWEFISFIVETYIHSLHYFLQISPIFILKSDGN